MPKTKVTVIIPTKNEEKNITSCLKNLQKQTYKNLEVIVVDNQSTDDTLTQLKTNFSWVKTIKLNKNLGFAKAINKGVKIAQSKYILNSK